MTKRRRLPSGLSLRGRSYVYEVRHGRLRGGRMVLSLRTDALDVAIERRQALLTVMDRGDWAIIERVRSGGVHVSDVQAAVRNRDMQALRRVGHAPTLLGDAVDQFLQRTEATATGRTYLQYRAACTMLVAHLGRDYPMEDMTVQAAESWLHGPKASAVGDVWSANSQRANRWIYSALWELAIERDGERADKLGLEPLLKRNPWREARVPELRQTRAVFLMPAEWLRLAERTEGMPHRALLALAFRAGLRREEIVQIRTDVDLVLDGLEPMVQVQSRAGEYPWAPKTKKSERDVPLTPDAVQMLRDHIAWGYAGERYLIHPTWHDKPLGLTTAEVWTREAYESAGIRYGRHGDALTLHSGRHTYASWMAQGGVPINIIADLLGNTMEVAYATYAHLLPRTLRESAMVGYRMVMEAE